ncbi:MAG: FecR domain-containing protein [Elusimicrobiales bacterium]
MRNNILSLFLLIALPGGAFAAEAKILSMNGAVEVRPTREGQWTSASENMEIAEGGGIRTGAEGGAVVLMPNKTKVWLKEGTALEIEQRQTLASRLALVFGKIKVRVPHLMRKEKFEVRTPAAVCAVRGTEFTMGTTEDGKTDVQVLFGEVKFKFTVPQAKGRSEFNIPQGQGLASPEEGKPAKPVLLTAKQERAALESWNPGLTAEQRQEGLIQKENDRAQIKDFARATANAEGAVKNFLNVAKESDLEAGRTLRDVHGNLVRVDQRLMRPNADEIQFFNLVKRPVYNYTKNSGAAGFIYNGAQGVVDRLDYMQMTMNFNKDLPQRIEEWPSFFDSNSIDPDWASFVVANRTNASEIFFVADNYKFDPSRDNGNGELVSNPWTIGIPTTADSPDDRKVIVTGVLTGATAVDGLNKISRLQIADAGSGALNYTDANGTPTTAVNAAGNVVWAIKTAAAVSYEAKETGDNVGLWQYQADMFDVGNAGTDFLWLAKENYVIDNGGGVRNVNDFTNSSTDPFSLLKDSAVQSIMYVKQSNSTTPGAITSSALAKAAVSDTDYFNYAGTGTNIDVVFIPDLMVAAVQRMLPAITNLGE